MRKLLKRACELWQQVSKPITWLKERGGIFKNVSALFPVSNIFLGVAAVSKKEKRNIGGRVLLLVVGCLLALWGVWLIALGVAGNEAGATVTSVRRQGGDLANPRAGSYVYHIGYRFYTEDGKCVEASTQTISGAATGAAEGTSMMRVRYFAFFPYLSAPDKDTGLSAGPLIFITVGGLLLYVALAKTNSKKRRVSKSL